MGRKWAIVNWTLGGVEKLPDAARDANKGRCSNSDGVAGHSPHELKVLGCGTKLGSQTKLGSHSTEKVREQNEAQMELRSPVADLWIALFVQRFFQMLTSGSGAASCRLHASRVSLTVAGHVQMPTRRTRRRTCRPRRLRRRDQ